MLDRSFGRHAEQNQTGMSPQATPWLLLSLALAAALHFSHTPIWLTLALAGILVWRTLVYRGRVRLPPLWVKVILLLFGIGFFIVSARGQFTIENAVGFFLLTYGLKLLETGSVRDAYLFVFMTLFLMPLGFLFSQSILTVIFVFGALTLAFVALMGVNGSLDKVSPAGAVGKSLSLMAWSLPILVVAYVFFPRMGPIWSMPLNSTSAFTGLSDSMMPGQVADLAQSSARAFRVDFHGPVPPSSELYWRSMALDLFLAGQWSRSSLQRSMDEGGHLPLSRLRRLGLEQPVVDSILAGSNGSYSVLLDPHNRDWGFALSGSAPDSQRLQGRSSGRGAAVLQTLDGLVRFGRPIKSPAAYTMNDWPKIAAAEEWTAELLVLKPPGLPAIVPLGPEPGVTLDDRTRRQLLQLPASDNPRARRFAAELRGLHDTQSGFVYALLEHFRTEPFTYTLEPPLLNPESSVDDFLFGERRGFCEHFASAAAVLLRSVGIPARIMTGYQGGEMNVAGGFLVVRQYDAHAWVEAWLDDRGWVRIDPTAAVSPERIESGLRSAVEEEGSFLSNELSLTRFSGIGALNWLAMRFEYANYLWQKWVINYDQGSQQNLFSRLFGKVDMQAATILGAAAITSIVFLVGALQLWRGRTRGPRRSQVAQVYDSLLSRLRRAGFEKQGNGATPAELARLLPSAGVDPGLATDIGDELERLLYRDGATSASIRQLKRLGGMAAAQMRSRQRKNLFRNSRADKANE